VTALPAVYRCPALEVPVHELSMCEAIARTVADHAAGRTVRSVTVRIGYLRQVVPETLTFCWDIVTRTTELDGVELHVEHVPAVVACESWSTVTTLDVPVLACGSCGDRSVLLQSGDELLVASLDLAPGATVSGELD
jgi:hydrogenase nickel incorporation protein HypA/HybF